MRIYVTQTFEFEVDDTAVQYVKDRTATIAKAENPEEAKPIADLQSLVETMAYLTAVDDESGKVYLITDPGGEYWDPDPMYVGGPLDAGQPDYKVGIGVDWSLISSNLEFEEGFPGCGHVGFPSGKGCIRWDCENYGLPSYGTIKDIDPTKSRCTRCTDTLIGCNLSGCQGREVSGWRGNLNEGTAIEGEDWTGGPAHIEM